MSEPTAAPVPTASAAPPRPAVADAPATPDAPGGGKGPARPRRRALLVVAAGVVIAAAAAVLLPKGGDPAESDAETSTPNPTAASRPAGAPAPFAIPISDDLRPTPASRPATDSRPEDDLPPALSAAAAAFETGAFETARVAYVNFLATPGDLGAGAERLLGICHARLALVLAAQCRAEFGADDSGLPEPSIRFGEPGR